MSQRDPFRHLRGEGKARPHVPPEKLRVGQPRDVETGSLRVGDAARDLTRVRARRDPKTETHQETETYRPRRRSLGTSASTAARELSPTAAQVELGRTGYRANRPEHDFVAARVALS